MFLSHFSLFMTKNLSKISISHKDHQNISQKRTENLFQVQKLLKKPSKFNSKTLKLWMSQTKTAASLNLSLEQTNSLNLIKLSSSWTEIIMISLPSRSISILWSLKKRSWNSNYLIFQTNFSRSVQLSGL